MVVPESAYFKCPLCKSDKVIGVATATNSYLYCCHCHQRWGELNKGDIDANTRRIGDIRQIEETT